MSSKAAHIEKALRNEAALSRFNFEPELYEWYITLSFYAAVYWLRAYFASAGPYLGDAEDVTYNRFPSIVAGIYQAAHGEDFGPAAAMLRKFANLKNLSQRACYDCTPAWYARQTGDADSALKAIRAFVEGEGVTP